MSSYNLEGSVAIVTGATGILGRRYVEVLNREGAHVVIADLVESACEDLACGMTDLTGTQCLGLKVDVSDPESARNAVSTVVGKFGRVDLLLNNAATKGDDLHALFQPTVDYELEVWRRIMAVNIDGQFPVPYTPLTLPTNRECHIRVVPGTTPK